MVDGVGKSDQRNAANVKCRLSKKGKRPVKYEEGEMLAKKIGAKNTSNAHHSLRLTFKKWTKNTKLPKKHFINFFSILENFNIKFLFLCFEKSMKNFL